MSISLDQELVQRLARLFTMTFPKGATKGVAEIYYRDGYAEYPMKYLNTAGEPVEMIFKGWDSEDLVAQSDLIKLLSKNILSLRDGLSKKDPRYWNHFFLITNEDLSSNYRFSYQPELDARHEAETRAAIGDELYERYERERKEKAAEFAAEDAQARDQPVESLKQEASPMTQDELMSFLYWEVTEDAPAGWERVVVEAEVKTDASGHRHIHVAYRYFLAGDDTAHRFTTKNVIGPMNAISELEELMAAEGKGWQKGRFELLPERRFTFTPES